MEAKIIFPANSPDFETFSLTQIESFTIGRSGANDLNVKDADVSRRHCLIEADSEGNFFIEDLGSRNGTFVNGRKAGKQFLQHGDYIRVGRSRILFLIGDETVAMPVNQNFQFDDGGLQTHSETLIGVENQIYDQAPDLSALVKFGRALNEISDTSQLEQRFLEIILEIVPAERGAILLFEDNLEEPLSVCILNNEADEKMTISKTVSRRVLTENVALFSNDLSNDDFVKAKSLYTERITSVLCVPLNVGQKTGLIYLDIRNSKDIFDEKHLQKLSAISMLVSAALERQISFEELEKENTRLQNEIEIETDLLGDSDEIKKVLSLIKKVAGADTTVLISGESGTGKELAARTIHRNSRRREKPFVAINCAVLSENLLESDLFGHERGAFTGAINQKKGRLEIANGGTIFLDEIAELAPQLQAKLLRVLQEREFERVGGNVAIKTDVRLIAASNRNLLEEVKKGNFREDLYFRLNIVKLQMPALRERKKDILRLAQHFLEKFSIRLDRRVTGISKLAQNVLQNYSWTGNVRELENAIERAVLLGSTDKIQTEDLPEEIVAAVQTDFFKDNEEPTLYQKLLRAKREIITNAVEDAEGNYSEAARSLGIHPNNLHRLIRSLDIKQHIKKM